MIGAALLTKAVEKVAGCSKPSKKQRLHQDQKVVTDYYNRAQTHPLHGRTWI
jgi:hypothetical protein